MDERVVASFLPFWGLEGVQFQLVATMAPADGAGVGNGPAFAGEGEQNAPSPPVHRDRTPAEKLHLSGVLSMSEFHEFLGFPAGELSEQEAHAAVRSRLGLESLTAMTDEQYRGLLNSFNHWRGEHNE